MALITTIEQVHQYLRVRYNNSNATLPDIGAAEDRFIIPLTGGTIYNQLVAAAAAENPSELLSSLLDKVRRAVVALAYWQDLPVIHTQIGELGVVVSRSQNLEAAHRWEFESLRDSLALKSCAALETLIEFLYTNKTELDWTAPDGVNDIFRTGSEFSRYFTLFQPHRTFQSLRPIVRQVEDVKIKTLIGAAFFASLRDNENPSAQEKEAIRLVKLSVAHHTIHQAVATLPVRISWEGFTVALGSNDDQVSQGRQSANDDQLGRLSDTALSMGDLFLDQLKNYLDKNASETVFAAYRNSEYYSAPNTSPAEDPNANRKLFGF